MATCVADLEAKVTKAAADAADAYRTLVIRMAAGEEVSDKWAMQALRDAGKTNSDLEQELHRRKRVKELSAVVAERPAIAARHREINAALAAKKAEADAFSERIGAECKALHDEQSTIRSKSLAIDRAERELRDIQPPPADEVALANELQLVVKEVLRIEALIGGRPDPDVKLAESQRHAARAEELAAEYDKLGILDLTRRFELKQARNAAVRRRDEATDIVNKVSGDRHLWARLRQLHTQRDELLERQRQLRASRTDEE